MPTTIPRPAGFWRLPLRPRPANCWHSCHRIAHCRKRRFVLSVGLRQIAKRNIPSAPAPVAAAPVAADRFDLHLQALHPGRILGLVEVVLSEFQQILAGIAGIIHAGSATLAVDGILAGGL